MKFKYSVICDNTQENREWLEKVGYKSLGFFQGKKYLYATTSQRANAKEVWNEPYYGTVDDVDFYVSCGFVPILGNSPLFKAVSAMREDSDKYQLFVDDRENIFQCSIDNVSDYVNIDNARKLNLEELQERFKEK